jgi:EAL domain-containing protein (putative c-di-GMP-specific phosphodiesterase class I)
VDHIRRLPVDAIKVEKSYVSDMSELKSRVIVEQLIGMAIRAGICPIAEGVENRHQVSILNSMGCHFMQGYYYARSMPFNELLDLCQVEQHSYAG